MMAAEEVEWLQAELAELRMEMEEVVREGDELKLRVEDLEEERTVMVTEFQRRLEERRKQT